MGSEARKYTKGDTVIGVIKWCGHHRRIHMWVYMEEVGDRMEMFLWGFGCALATVLIIDFMKFWFKDAPYPLPEIKIDPIRQYEAEQEWKKLEIEWAREAREERIRDYPRYKLKYQLQDMIKEIWDITREGRKITHGERIYKLDIDREEHPWNMYKDNPEAAQIINGLPFIIVVYDIEENEICKIPYHCSVTFEKEYDLFISNYDAIKNEFIQLEKAESDRINTSYAHLNGLLQGR
jgi:hypothetical protein